MHIDILPRRGIRVLIATFLVSTKVAGQPARAVALEIGASLPDCQSVLHLGPQECGSDRSGHASSREDKIKDISAGSQMEARIDAYMASYGKPPREAVRALLDPTDDNIRSFLQQQETTLALAGYVASRMTALKQAGSILADQHDTDLRDEQTFRQLRISLFQTAGDSSTRGILRALAELCRSVPSLQAGVQLAGPVDSTRLKEEIGRIDPSLTVAVAQARSVDSLQLPFLRIENLQNGSTYDIDARALDIWKIRAAAIAARAAKVPGTAMSAPARAPGTGE